ncbi:thiosulfate sulfurtransferase 18-like isoform X2 [Sorghum bicolor]|uniref:thiosulfate sulfurtransferase 18-like isoform X2 n=1 Tax=Sorghum bicolor TaxID=4558 RepID=UPI000B424BD0|nr:thiosulfate sulfurtransferase 18-like isoform X2 [Sorghum bicolor]|eukprot:XP_021318362.1 thiosulfate sulfurtransferase 18-like isoform X2 [Sorghum bicolor]
MMGDGLSSAPCTNSRRRMLPLLPLFAVSLFPGLWSPSSGPARMTTMRPAILLTICTLSALLLVARGLEKPSVAPVVAVGVAAASDLIRSGGHRYLDVRTEEEFRNGHVEDSLNVPYLFFTSQGREKNPRFVAQVAADFDKEDNIVVGCKSGVRSELACADLMAAHVNACENRDLEM